MYQKFFKINLNKYGELRRKIETEKRTFRITAISFVVFTAILYAFVLFLNNNLEAKIKSRKDLIKEINDEIKAYRVSGEYLSSKDLQRLARVSTERIFWSKKLVALSEKTKDKIAITHFSFKNDVLSLFGITQMDKEQKEHDLIDEYIEELKKNKQISGDFPEIKFVKSSQDFEKDVEIIRFQIDFIQKDYDKEGK